MGEIHFIGTPVTDSYDYLQSRDNPRTSSFSIFDADLAGYGLDEIYTLNRANYDAAHKFLIPRAVSYSAGFIDYFFRGRIEATGAEGLSDGAT